MKVALYGNGLAGGGAEGTVTLVAREFLVAPATFTRAGATGTRFNANVALEVMGANVPRFDFGRDLIYRGQLSELSRINLFLNSGAPVTQGITLPAAVHTVSFWGTGSVTLSGAATGTLNGTGALNRVTLTFTPSAGVVTFTLAGAVEWPQVEAGPYASSYTPTGGAATTRDADVATISGAAFASIWNPLAGSMLSVTRKMADETASLFPRIWDANDGTTNNRLSGFYATAANTVGIGPVLGGVSVGTASASIVETARSAVGMSWDAANLSIAVNGAAPVNAAATGLPTVNQLHIGHFLTGSQLGGWIERLIYVPRRMSPNELRAWSASA